MSGWRRMPWWAWSGPCKSATIVGWACIIGGLGFFLWAGLTGFPA